MKILHTSDWHLGRRPAGWASEFSDARYLDYFKAAENIAELATTEKVDLVIIAGDLFDSPKLDPETLGRAERIFEYLKANDIKTIVVAGNHDTSSDRKSWLDYLHERGLVLHLNSVQLADDDDYRPFLPIRIDDLNIFGIPYVGALIDEVLSELVDFLERESSQGKNIVVCHTAIDDSDTASSLLPGCVKPWVLERFIGKVTYFAAGHFHSFRKYPKDNPFLFIPGSPEYWDLYEKEPKGVVIFDTETRKYRFVESLRRKRTIHRIPLEELKARVNSLDVSNGEIVILEVTVDTTDLRKNLETVDRKKLTDKLTTKGALRVEVKYEFPKLAGNAIEPGLLSREEIERELIAGWRNEFSSSERLIALTHSFIQTSKKLLDESNDVEKIGEHFDRLLETVIGGESRDHQESCTEELS